MQTGAAVSARSDGGFAFGAGQRRLGRHWLRGIANGRVSARRDERGLVLTAEAAYPITLVIGTLAAVPLGVFVAPLLGAAAWLWFVGGNYVFALVAIRSHLNKATVSPVGDPASD